MRWINEASALIKEALEHERVHGDCGARSLIWQERAEKLLKPEEPKTGIE